MGGCTQVHESRGADMTSGVSVDAQAMMAFESRKKSAGVAYLLLIFLGGLGAHRFYLGRTGSAIGQLVLFILGWATAVIVVGFFLLAALGIWLIVDLFLVPGIAERHNGELMKSLAAASPARAAPAVDELAKFAALREQGAISEEEYEAQKRRLIGAPPSATPPAPIVE
jgi:TM2 domain-containing membrane protein YozV